MTFSALAGILILWQAVSWAGLVPHYMLPSPVDVVKAFFADFGLLMQHARVTLAEAALGDVYKRQVWSLTVFRLNFQRKK